MRCRYIEENKKINDEEMAKYAFFVNQLCAKNSITTFWWDTSFLIDRVNLDCFQKVVNKIMECYPGKTYKKTTKGFVEEDANQAATNMKVGWNLGNTLDANKYKAIWNPSEKKWIEECGLSGLETETCWYEPKTTKEMIHYVKSLGFNSVRLPVTWIGHLDENSKIDLDWMNRVKEIVDYILNEDMYCILNVHHDGGSQGWVRACESSFTQFSKRLEIIYSQICEVFGDYDERLLFEGVNEILDEFESWSDPTDVASFWINKWNQLFVDTVRKSGKNNSVRNLIVMAGAGKETIPALEKFNMPKDSVKNHLIFEFHNYDPQEFCWPKRKDETEKIDCFIWDEEKHGAIVKNKIENCLSVASKFGVPIILGEYGAWPKAMN